MAKLAHFQHNRPTAIPKTQTTSDMRKTMSDVEKIISDVGKITSDIIFANISGWATVSYA